VCFSFSLGLLFINFSSFKPDVENNASFENYTSYCLSTWRRSAKKTKFENFDQKSGALKMLDVKMMDMKLTDQCAGHEIA